jgi:hypothetical protein
MNILGKNKKILSTTACIFSTMRLSIYSVDPFISDHPWMDQTKLVAHKSFQMQYFYFAQLNLRNQT